MGFDVKNNSGSLFTNDRKTGPNHPDKKGKFLINGQWMWGSLWQKVSGQGVPWDSMSFEVMKPEDVAKYCGGQQPVTQPQRQPAPQRQAPPQRQPPQQSYQQQRPAYAPPPKQQPPFPDSAGFTDADLPFASPQLNRR